MIRTPGHEEHSFTDTVHEELSTRLTQQQYLTWFQRVLFRPLGPDVVRVTVPNRFYMTFLKHRYLPIIAECVETATGMEHPRIEFQVNKDTDAEAEASSWSAIHSSPTETAVNPMSVPCGTAMTEVFSATTLPKNIPLNENYVFDEFVVGPNNRLAHAASVAVADSPGTAYNPLFLYGSVGLGKTHLLQAVAHKYAKLGKTNIVYLSCQDFTNDFITAISANSLDGFRRKYREGDALLIDDIQLLAKRERTQEEFFHTFNSIYNQQRQILLTSDSLPSEITGLGDRLVSRFKLGLVAELTPPSFDTRVAIIQRKAQKLRLAVPTDVVEFVATRVRENVRELEGVLHRLHSLVTIERRQLTVEEVRESLADLFGQEDRRIDILSIQQRVLEEFNVRSADLHSRSRTRSVVVPRQICMFLARKHTPLSLGEIGIHFGGRDHSTVLHAIEKVKSLIDKDPRIRGKLQSIERQLGA